MILPQLKSDISPESTATFRASAPPARRPPYHDAGLADLGHSLHTPIPGPSEVHHTRSLSDQRCLPPRLPHFTHRSSGPSTHAYHPPATLSAGSPSRRRPGMLNEYSSGPLDPIIAPLRLPPACLDANRRPAKRTKKLVPTSALSRSDDSTAPPDKTYKKAAEAKEKRRRTLIACERCRQHKLRCLGGPKPCTACAKRGVGDSCEFVAEVRRRGKAKKSQRIVGDGVDAALDEAGSSSSDIRPSLDGAQGASKPYTPGRQSIDPVVAPTTGLGQSAGTSRRSSASGSASQPLSILLTEATTGTDGSWSSETRASLSTVGTHAGICASSERKDGELTRGLRERMQAGISIHESSLAVDHD